MTFVRRMQLPTHATVARGMWLGAGFRMASIQMKNALLIVALAKKYKVKLAWGTDILFSAKGTARQGVDLVVIMKDGEIVKNIVHERVVPTRSCTT